MDQAPLPPKRRLDSARGKRGASRTVDLTLRLCRNRITAYVLISFFVGLGFHAVEKHADNQFKQQVYKTCVQGNIIRRQTNERLMELKAKPVKLVDCRPLLDN